MKVVKKIAINLLIIIVLLTTTVNAHGGNISGWKDKNSDKVTLHDGKYYGYHNENGKRHYHEVKWNEEKQKWEIVMSAVYYDENFNKISNNNEVDNETEKIQVTFSKKVDGDTAKFKLNGEIITVRFLGIDTPETVHPTKGEEPYGKEASNFTEEKLKNATKIELEYDKNSSKTDKYERHLAWIWVDDILLQNELVKNGLAKTYMLQDNYKYADVLQESEQEAKSQKLNIWSNEGDEVESQTKSNADNESSSETEEYTTTEIIIMICVFAIGVIFKISKKKR